MRQASFWFTIIAAFVSFALPASAGLPGSYAVQVTQLDPSAFPQFQVYVAVADLAGFPVVNLSATHFRIFEDEQEYPVLEAMTSLALDQDEFSNLAVALVIDNSASMSESMKKVEKAAMGFIENLRKQDLAAIIIFDKNKPKQKARIHENFTSVKFSLKQKTRMKQLTEHTYLNDALFIACQAFEPLETLGRKAIVVLSDGADNASSTELTTVIAAAKKNNIPIFPINFNRQAEESILRQLATETGGKYYYSPQTADLAELYVNILKELQGQYRLTYQPDQAGWQKTSRSIRVEARIDAHLAAASRSFETDQAYLSYLNLLYKEKTVTVNEQDYLNYLHQYPQNEWVDDIQFKLGVFYEESGDFQKARQIFEELSNYPQSEWQDDVMFHQGKMHFAEGNHTQAINEYQALVSRFPVAANTPSALLALARAFREQKDFVNAQKHYLKLKDEFPGSDLADEALLELAYLAPAETDAARALLKELLQKYPESNCAIHAYYELAGISRKAGDWVQAHNYCNQGLTATDDPTLKAKITCLIATISLDARNWEAAETAFEQVLTQYPKNGYDDDARFGLANLYRDRQDLAGMRQQYTALEQMQQQGEMLSFDLTAIDAQTGAIPPETGGLVTTLSGARFEIQPGTLSFPLNASVKAVPTPETAQNLAIAGKVYDFSADKEKFFTPVRIALPYQDQWFSETQRDPAGFKLYTEHEGQWEVIPNSQIDTTGKVIFADVSHLSLKTIMYQPPIILRFNDILFDFGQANLTTTALTQLDTVISLMQQSQQVKLEVAGHTDDVGSDLTNLALSQKRAESIKNYLVKRGVALNRIISKGYGEKYPVTENQTDQGRQLNRRTEFIVISKGENDIVADSPRRYRAPGFTIQLGEYPYLNQAEEAQTFYSRRGVPVEIVERVQNQVTRYSLCTGSFEQIEAAKQQAVTLKNRFKNLQCEIVER